MAGAGLALPVHHVQLVDVELGAIDARDDARLQPDAAEVLQHAGELVLAPRQVDQVDVPRLVQLLQLPPPRRRRAPRAALRQRRRQGDLGGRRQRGEPRLGLGGAQAQQRRLELGDPRLRRLQRLAAARPAPGRRRRGLDPDAQRWGCGSGGVGRGLWPEEVGAAAGGEQRRGPGEGAPLGPRRHDGCCSGAPERRH